MRRVVSSTIARPHAAAMTDPTPLLLGQTLLELHVADVDLDAFASLFQRLRTAGITFTTLREWQTVDPRWLEQFTFLDNETRSTSGNPAVPRTVAAMRDRLSELALDPAACSEPTGRISSAGTLTNKAKPDDVVNCAARDLSVSLPAISLRRK